jgi:histidinol-phosphate aminotransferase
VSVQVQEEERREPGANGSGLVRAAVRRMAGYVPGEQPVDPGVVKLNTNENPYPPSPRVKEAVARASEQLWLYPEPTARPLRVKLAEVLGVPAEGVVVGNGSDEILALLMRAVVAPGEAVAYPVPTYSLYDSLVAIQGGVAEHHPFAADFSLPEELFASRARMRIVCNPNSPSGTLIPQGELERLARSLPGSLLVVDEAYVDFADQSAIAMVGRLANVVVLRTLSKSYSLAGLRVGFALTTPELARELHKVRDSYNVGRLPQAGALAALEDQAWMRGNVEKIRATRERLSRALGEIGYSVLPSQANFVLARRPGKSLAGVAAALRDQGVLVRHFAAVPDALRISVGTDAQVDVLLERLAVLGP